MPRGHGPSTEEEARLKRERTADLVTHEKVHEQTPVARFATLRRKTPDRHFRDRLTFPPRIILV